MNEKYSLTGQIDSRKISKSKDQEGRDQLAERIIKDRADSRETKTQISQKEERVNELSNVRTEQYKELASRERALKKRRQELAYKIKKIFKFNDKSAQQIGYELNEVTADINKSLTEEYQLLDQLKELSKKYENFPDPKELVTAYYEKFSKEKLTIEQKRELLKAEALAQLSTEQYIKLWRKLNPHFVSHVTRQGFRDHNAMMYHSAGLQEFHDGFTQTMSDSDKLLRPPIGLGKLKYRSKEDVKAWMGDWVFEGDKKEAVDRLDRLMNATLASAPHYPDKMAVHFAAQVVADDYYGSEAGNEVFYLFPSDFIASQHDFAFNGWQKDFTKPQSELKWNDVFVWPETVENAGISIDAGLVFLPKNTLVDPETGSKYASNLVNKEEKMVREMVEDQELIDAFVHWGQGLNDPDNTIRKLIKEWREERNYWEQQDLQRNLYTRVSNELVSIGIADDSAMKLASNLVGQMISKVINEDNLSNSELSEMIKNSGAHYKRASDTISSEEYWNNYFSINPLQKPKHIIYYDGDPTRAVLDFLKENGISQGEKDKEEVTELLGFEDRHVENMAEDPRANAGKDELQEMGLRIIEEHYSTSTQKEKIE